MCYVIYSGYNVDSFCLKYVYFMCSVFVDECKYEPYPGDPTKYWIHGNDMTIEECGETMMFFNVENLCNCVPVDGGV